MEQPVIRILGIAPYDGMRTAMEKVAASFPGIHLDVFTGDMEEGAEIACRYSTEDYDVVISRGGTAQLVQKATELPVVSIRLSVYDILRAIKMAESYSDRYAVVGFPSITEPAHTLCDLLGYDLDIFTVNSSDEVFATLAHLKQRGYKMVVSDVITHTHALQNGLTAFLITSGMEGIHSAFEEAIRISGYFSSLRQEVLFLRRIAQERESNTVILDQNGEVCYSVQDHPAPEQLSILRQRIPEIPLGSQLKFYHNDRGNLYQISAYAPRIGLKRYYMFRYFQTRIPLRSTKPGIRSLSAIEVSHLTNDSFYNISGAMGELEDKLTLIASSYQPVMLVGEPGTAKEQIARAIYLRSPHIKGPFITIDCTVAAEREWDFLFNHYASPLNDRDITVYFRHIEAISDQHRAELLAAGSDTNLTRRVRLIFSIDCVEDQPLPETAEQIISRMGCCNIHVPTLRSRSDEISSLAGLYLNILNKDLGKDLVGFDPRAIEQLRTYDWPNNYTQFKKVLTQLATLATSPYIRGGAVAEVLAQERALHRPKFFAPSRGMDFTGLTLDQITQDVVRQVVDACGGNQTAAAKQLRISRSTLWRYLKSE